MLVKQGSYDSYLLTSCNIANDFIQEVSTVSTILSLATYLASWFSQAELRVNCSTVSNLENKYIFSSFLQIS